MSINFIDLSRQQKLIKEELDLNIAKVLEHGQYIMGPEVSQLEESLQNFTNSKHCITVASGTDALLISLMALGIGPGDEVITSPFTWVSTAEVIALVGATPVFCDIEEDTCNINANKIEDLITSKTKAVIPVSLYGQPSDMKEINLIAEKYNLFVVEDAAQSFGSTYDGIKSCNLSDIGCTSFFPSKPLGCYGDGGAIFTNDEILAQKFKEIRFHGQKERHVINRVGLNGRLDTLQAAILLAKLEVFDKEIKERQRIAAIYKEIFSDLPIQFIQTRENRTSVFAQFTIISDRRDELVESLKLQKIPTAIHYPVPVNQQPAYLNFCKKNTPLSDRLASKVFSLPMHPYLTESEISCVTDCIRKTIDEF